MFFTNFCTPFASNMRKGSLPFSCKKTPETGVLNEKMCKMPSPSPPPRSLFGGIFRSKHSKHTPLTIDAKAATEKILQNVEYKDTAPFYHNITYCKCVKVYDGDTITICTNDRFRFSVRLMGIDAPEIKGGGDNEKQLAIVARDELC